ncbi:MAG: hypothetical protein K2G87_00550, partial [Oscillospiraceae bacterium]|nr:hypothetical protein [Oscillospiraceae bacterium]
MKLFAAKDVKKVSAKAAAEEAVFRKQLLDELDFVTMRLSQIRESYDMTDEPELVDAHLRGACHAGALR